VSYTLDVGVDVQEQIAALPSLALVEDRLEVQLLIVTWAG
jgi:hypothetical protein